MNSEFTDCSIMKSVLYFCVFHVVLVGVFGEFVSVMEGDTVTLHTGLSEIQNDVAMDWRYGVEGNLIAQISYGAFKKYIYEFIFDGRFRNGLKLDNKTGDLTVRNFRPELSGLYEVTGSNRLSKMFNVSAVSVDEVKSVLVMVGESVTLHTYLTDVQTVNMIQWRFQRQISSIAEVNRKAGKVSYDDADERFRHRLHLDYLTGALTIRNIRIGHSGFYEADINSATHNIHKMFNVIVSGEKKLVSVMEGQSAFLQTGLPEILLDDYMIWMFADMVIAEIHKTLPKYADDRFRDRLQINNLTGSLTINECKTSDSGLYELKISSNRHSVHQRFIVTVDVATSAETTAIVVFLLIFVIGLVVLSFLRRNCKVKDAVKSLWLMEEVSITLQGNAQLQTGDQILWTFGDKNTPIAEIKDTAEIIYYHGPDGRFRDRLMLETTGDLTITNTRTVHSGDYKLKIMRNAKTSFKRFHLTFFDIATSVLVMKDDLITLNTDTELQPDDKVLWKFKDEATVIAKTKGVPRESTTLHGPGGRFRNRMKLDQQTRSLAIKDSRTADSGQYKLEIIRSGKTSVKLFIVTISDPAGFGNLPEEVALLEQGHFSDSN
ncbi:uncharacterized protein LOC130216125 [Danio aesculapii]|uniref:uncharacterized protein LOC130216125 n=1 Tax=Danio aesculapii TaxID=1142201 RepID=UPI0024BF49CF|nr:uncharacterized protein LOC130216125 [Danio aesculapii]